MCRSLLTPTPALTAGLQSRCDLHSSLAARSGSSRQVGACRRCSRGELLLKICVVACLILFLSSASFAGELQWGVNGHPFVQESYRDVPIETQLDWVRRLGARWYRSDWGGWAVEKDGLFKVKHLVSEVKKRGIQVLPIIFPPVDLRNDSEEAIYRKSFDYARALVSELKADITFWELHNELDLFAMIRKGEKMTTGGIWQWGDPDGDCLEHYEEGRYRKARAVLRGLADGVRAADASAVRIINSGGWLHYGFVQRLVSDGVPFEVLAWHWYSEMGDIANVRGNFNLLQRLCEFGKPIWITELNRRGGSLGENGEAAQAQSLRQTLTHFADLAKRYPLHAVFVYELFDEPYFGADNPESHYGLIRVRKGSDGRWTVAEAKQAFNAMKDLTMSGQSPKPPSSSASQPTFSQLPESIRHKIDLRLRKRSDEIVASPFATLTSFEVHGESEDADVVRIMQELGVRCVVMHNIHGSLPNADDRRLNRWLEMCAKAGIQVRCILVSRDVELWKKAVRNFGDRIKHFGFLNESNAPTNNDHTKPNVSPADYVAELQKVREAIKRIRPDVRLWAPECAMLQCMEESPYPWLRLAIEAGLLKVADGITIHPYRQAYSPKNVPDNPSTFEGRPTPRYRTYEEQIQTLRQMVKGKPIAVTEVGWSTAPKGPLASLTTETITELTQAKFALRQQAMDFALGLDVAVYFLLRERYVDAPFPAGHLENHFGIVRVDNSPKPAYIALQTLYSQLDNRCKPNERVKVHFSVEGVKWFVFDDTLSAIPTRKIVYWLPVPARDDFPVERVNVQIDDMLVHSVLLSDAPRMVRLHRIDGRWGYPVLIDFIKQTADGNVEWEWRKR